MSDALAAWLAAREPAPPPALARALERAVAATAAGAADPARLTDAAAAALRRALALGDGRPAAWELLAADALLTAAIERAAEEGSESLETLLAALSPAAIAALTGGQG